MKLAMTTVQPADDGNGMDTLESLHQQLFEDEAGYLGAPPTLVQPHALRFVDSYTTYGVGDLSVLED